MPDFLDGRGSSSCLDAVEAARRFAADLVYLDPPYNQHSYLGNYHVWESLVRWDRPEVYGVAMKRCDVRERGSRFNRRGAIEGALREVVESLTARWILVSFSDEGYLTPDQVEGLLRERGSVSRCVVPHPRYVGHQIGIYNPAGVKVGTPGHGRNRELLFLVETEAAGSRRRSAVRRARRPAAFESVVN